MGGINASSYVAALELELVRLELASKLGRPVSEANDLWPCDGPDCTRTIGRFVQRPGGAVYVCDGCRRTTPV